MKKTGLIAAVALVGALTACSRTKDGDVVVERPGDVDIKTTTDTLHLPKAPDIDLGLKKDTVIFSRPSVTVNRDSLKKKRDTIR